MIFFRILLAHIFRIIFGFSFFRKYFFGIHQKWFQPNHIFKGIILKRKLFGDLIFELNIDDWIQENLFFLGTYENAELRLFRELLKDKACFIDIGANIGLYSLNASRVMNSDAKIFAFEPFSTNNDALLKNIKLNSINNIQVENKAVSNKSESITLFYDKEEKNLGTVSSISTDHSEEEKVNTICLDEFVMANNIKEINFIKIDIEGGEYFALQGMKMVLKKYRPQILIEMDPQILLKTSYSSKDIDAYLFALGYVKYYIDERGQITLDASLQSSNNYLFKAK